MAGASGVDWTGILFVVILALTGVTRKTERMFARTAGLFCTPQRPVGVCRIQISRCFVVSLCALLTAPLSVSPSSVQSLSLGPGWCWAVTCSGQAQPSLRQEAGRARLTTLTVRLSQRVMTGLAAPGPLLPGIRRRITHHSALTGTRDRAACVKYFLSTDFSQTIFRDFSTRLFSHIISNSSDIKKKI